MGGSGLVGTVSDYLRFAQMLVNKGEYNGTRILGGKTVEFMTSQSLDARLPPRPADQPVRQGREGETLGLRFRVDGIGRHQPGDRRSAGIEGTFGWGGAATTHFWVDHEEELLGIVHTQLLPDGTYPVRELMQSLTYQAVID